MKPIFFAIILAFTFFKTQLVNGATPIKVPITFIEALAPKDTTASERFQTEYKAAINAGKELSKSKLARCGYELSEKMVFYDASDNIQALEQAKKSSEEGAWFLIGPRRSNHYLLFAQGSPNTPSVSLMASATEVSKLGPTHLSMASSNSQMARVAAAHLKTLSPKAPLSYVTILSEDCVTCVDFAQEFDKAASQKEITKKAELKIVGETPNPELIKEFAKKHKPKYVLLPNYSKVSAAVIHALLPVIPHALFIGGDGWGDSKYGFIQNNENLNAANGLTVRGFPPAKEGLKEFPLGEKLLKTKNSPELFSGSAQAIVRIFDGLSSLLCESKPKTLAEFRTAFTQLGSREFSAPWGVSLYNLKAGEIIYQGKRSE